MKDVRHILSLSGGKDSAALAVYMRDRQPGMEYVFCDTKKELRETYEYLDRLEAYLGRKVERLNAERGFDHWLQVYGGYLPSPRMRWCTRQLKLKKSEWVGLLETHPELFEEAKQYEKVNPATGERYTWSQGESLEELSRPERVQEIKQRRLRVINSQPPGPNRSLMQVFATDDDGDDEKACLICDL
jgi:hypothetical protein